MTVYTLMNIITYLFINFNASTTLVFDSPIEYVTPTNQNDFSIYKSKNQKLLTIKPFKNNFNTIITVITKDGAFPFVVSVKDEMISPLYKIEKGEVGTSYVSLKDTEDYELLGGEKILLLRLKNTKYKKVNDLPAQTAQYLPKGAKIKLDEVFLDY